MPKAYPAESGLERSLWSGLVSPCGRPLKQACDLVALAGEWFTVRCTCSSWVTSSHSLAMS